jgi:outer membrane lipoprotein-sorting protein
MRARSILIALTLLLGLAASGFAQTDLTKVLKAMDQQAANFRNAQADFVWDQFTVVVSDHDLEQGTIYFRREGKNTIEMAADIKREATEQVNGKPVKKLVPAQYVLFDGEIVKVYDRGLDRVTEYNAGKNKAEFESFLVLGFGGSGQDLEKSFDVKFDGMENVGGVDAAKLELTPKSAKVKNMFSQIVLWIDPARGVSVQQKFLTSDGDYRLATYSNIVINSSKMPDDVFKLKTTSKTTTVKPQG